ncbi:pyridoxal phosphate-dependent aminotransferase [Salininema proteolyticum]|uniref:Aminotransferase n=1 Tax=Salininema proteolyticum TaxID=1607685 RepID=A0ABV8U0B3_9ACTN
MTISATLAANEAVAARRAAGADVVALAFGEANLPVHPLLRNAYLSGAGRASYGPVAGLPAAREALAGYFTRQGLATSPDRLLLGPGTKPILYTLLGALGGEVAVPTPAWVSYAAQADLLGISALRIPVPGGEGGAADPALLRASLEAARAEGRRPTSMLMTMPDNPTGLIPSESTVRELCAIAEEYDLVIISDEIYRDLVHEGVPVPSPALYAPERTVVTTGLSKNFALGGWRMGAARFPDGERGERLCDRVRSWASEIWSTPPLPAQHVAAVAWSDAPELRERVEGSARLHGTVARAVAEVFREAGADVAKPQGGFYVWPDFGPARGELASRGVETSADLTAYLAERDVFAIPGTEFGDAPENLTMRIAVPGLYGTTDTERSAALEAGDPLSVPWIEHALERLSETLADLTVSRPSLVGQGV